MYQHFVGVTTITLQTEICLEKKMKWNKTILSVEMFPKNVFIDVLHTEDIILPPKHAEIWYRWNEIDQKHKTH